MLHYPKLFCQLKTRTVADFGLLLFCLLLASCGQSKYEKDYIDRDHEIQWNTVTAPAQWFKTPRRFALQNELGAPLPHPFYDLAPYIDYPKRLVSFYVTTPVEGPGQYEIELLSGRKYLEHRYCTQRDVWGKYSGYLTKPNYTEGFLPRVLDEVGRPMKIRVFGRDLYYKQADYGDAAHRVRVIGGVMESACGQLPCHKDSDWKSHLVVIAVDPADPKFKKVEDLIDLKKVVDWEYAKAFMQNAQGSLKYLGKRVPGYRITGEFPALLTLRMATTYGNLITVSELGKIRKACHKLYDYAWDKLGHEQYSKEKVEITESIKDVSHFSRVQNKNKNENKDDEDKKYKIVKTLIPFSKRWKDFVTKFGNHYLTCSDYVYPSNISEGVDRHWFLNYMAAFFRMWRMNYRYDCTSSSWTMRSHLTKSKRSAEMGEIMKNCSDKSIDMAFVRAVDQMQQLQKEGKDYWRYLEYDYHINGVHDRIQSWALFSHRDMECRGGTHSDVYGRINDSAQRVFPQDVRWNFHRKYGDDQELQVRLPR